MPSHTTTIWTCSRCGSVEEIEGMGQPSDWTRWYFRTPPLAGSEKETAVGDLCNQCGGYAVEFIHGKERDAMERDRRIAEVLSVADEGDSDA